MGKKNLKQLKKNQRKKNVAGAREDAGLASTGPVLVNLNNLYKVSEKKIKKKYKKKCGKR